MVLLESGYMFADGDMSKLTTLQSAFVGLTLKTKIDIITGKGDTPNISTSQKSPAGVQNVAAQPQAMPSAMPDGTVRRVETKRMSSREYIAMRKKERGLG